MDPERPDAPPRPDLAAALRALRAVRGWTQLQLAEAAAIGQRTVQRYEAGEQEISSEALAGLVHAAGLHPVVFDNVLVPAMRIVLHALEIGPEDYEGGDGEEPLEAVAGRIGQEVAESVRAVVLEHYIGLDREAAARAANAWRPKPEDREAVPDLLRRLARYAPDEREFLVETASPFASWALAERLAESALEGETGAVPDGTAEPGGDWSRGAAAGSALGGPLDRARLALLVARKVPGPASWAARIEGYARAFLSQALHRAGDEEEATGERAEAERLWAAGTDEGEVLDEGRFQRALRPRQTPIPTEG